jgi:hypothetical protein
MTPSLGVFLHQPWPVLLSLSDVAFEILVELLQNRRIEVEIELSVLEEGSSLVLAHMRASWFRPID